VGHLVIDGELVQVDGATVHNFLDTGMSFVAPKGVHPRPKDAVVNKIVLHWTASERDGEEGARTVLRNMSARKDAGCHMLVTNDGQVWQFNDLMRDMASHVSHRVVNPASIGIEVSDYGWLKDHTEAPSAGRNREKYVAVIHGWRTTFADYYPTQHDAVQAVCTAICEHLGIPKEVMLEPWRVRSNKKLRNFAGVLGHLHCASGRRPKTDPATKPLELLADYWK